MGMKSYLIVKDKYLSVKFYNFFPYKSYYIFIRYSPRFFRTWVTIVKGRIFKRIPFVSC